MKKMGEGKGNVKEEVLEGGREGNAKGIEGGKCERDWRKERNAKGMREGHVKGMRDG